MGINSAFSSFIIGEGTLPIQCAELLVEHGHRLCGFLSADALIQRWADERGISCIAPSGDLLSPLRQQPFDYLFSIVNGRVLPAQILALPRRGAINYHDAPLPRYAGMHAPSWALINGETVYGVTWHAMTEGVDEGDILVQRRFEVAAGETALTLNAKCYQAAIESFAEIVDHLSQGEVRGRPQELEHRTYFPRHQRPAGGGALFWSQPAQKIDALVRALDHGPYPNRLAIPKLALGAEFLLVPQIEVLERSADGPPGRVTSISEDTLTVSTATRQVAIRKLLTVEGVPLPLPEVVARFGLRVGYRLPEVTPETRERLTAWSEALCRHEPFWVERLAGLQPVELPEGERPVSPVSPAPYESVWMPIPESFAAYREARQVSGSQSDLLLTAFAAYLARIAGTRAFDVGYGDGELQRELAGLESFFALLVPLRVDIDITRPFADAHRAVQEQLAQVRLHRTYARDVTARYPSLRSAGDPRSRHAFPVAVQQTSASGEGKPAAGSDLTVWIARDGSGCRWVYRPDVIDSARISGMIRQFKTLLQGLVAHPEEPVARLPLLSDEERHHFLVTLNDTRADYPRDRCLHELFEEQSKRTPHAIAATFENEALTYASLDRRANQLAHHLQGLGVGPEILVGLCLERSLELPVAVLGILKAGGAYLPLDPAYPRERLAAMLADARAPVLITQERLLPALPADTARAVCLDRDREAIDGQSAAPPWAAVTADNLAYVIYTSGSTGRPKGVMIAHRAICNHMFWRRAYFGLTGADRVLLNASISFDDSVWQIFEPLMVGARLVLARPGGDQEGDYLVRLIVEEQITVVTFVPSALHLFLEQPEVVRCRSVQRVETGGETLTRALQQRVFDRLSADLYNGYGPTEATIASTFWICRRGDDSPAVPIGRPIANTQIYLLDPFLQPVPFGLPGELYIGGECLARGYLHQPQLTAERFIPHPFSPEPGARLYKTGDLARYRPDGNLEFLGRLDDQVKVRGFRIEPGEIEAALGRHPAVRAAVVVAREDEPGRNRLVAYVVTRGAAAPDGGELRRFLQQWLPDYMLPSAFVRLARLPLTPSGKMDRRALPAPGMAHSEREQVSVAPGSPMEAMLAGIWGELLRLERVGVDDDFFELGGDSLVAMRLISRLEREFQLSLPMRCLFQAPTVAGLAATITQRLAEQLDPDEKTRLLAELAEAETERAL